MHEISQQRRHKSEVMPHWGPHFVLPTPRLQRIEWTRKYVVQPYQFIVLWTKVNWSRSSDDDDSVLDDKGHRLIARIWVFHHVESDSVVFDLFKRRLHTANKLMAKYIEPYRGE